MFKERLAVVGAYALLNLIDGAPLEFKSAPTALGGKGQYQRKENGSRRALQ